MGPIEEIHGQHHEVIVIGAGLAGLATAGSLVSRGVGSVLVIEAENRPGVHSSGRNAGLIRQAAEDAATTRLCVRGAELIREWGVESAGLFEQSGSLILSTEEQIPEASWALVEHTPLSETEVRLQYPELEDWPGGRARFSPADGMVDVPRLLGQLVDRIEGGGGQVCFGIRAGRVRINSPGDFSVELSRDQNCTGNSVEEVHSRQMVIANGAWAGEFSAASQMPVNLITTNRGCVQTKRGRFAPSPRPWIWAHTAGWYLRNFGEDLLWSSCEEELAMAGDCQLSHDLESRWRDTTRPNWGKSVASIDLIRGWIGQRTFCPDRRFLLGADSRCDGWQWAVGLGGHGVTSALAVGEQVADSVEGKDLSPEWRWSEERFDLLAHGLS